MSTVTQIKERPILFSGPMVLACLDGRKRQTRRIVKGVFKSHCRGLLASDPSEGDFDCIKDFDGLPSRIELLPRNSELCPYGVPGERLWVREAFVLEANDEVPAARPCREVNGEWGKYVFPHYRADGYEPYVVNPERATDEMFDRTRWTPSIHMPRWASRLTLEIESVRVERLRDISANDIIAEGAVARSHNDPILGKSPISAFDGCCYPDLISLWANGWDKINGKGSFASNPWVWAISFRVLTRATT